MTGAVTAARVGMWASASAALFTFLFAVTLNVNEYLDCALSMPLAMSYVLLALGNKYSHNDGNRIFADAAVVFAAIYCTCGWIVYYVQISFVRLARASPEALSVAQQPPPSAFFAIDMLAYTFLGISTVFLAMSIDASRLIKSLLLLNGVSSIGGFSVPLMPFVYEQPADDDDYSDYALVLLPWAALFITICVLLCLHFRRILLDDAGTGRNDSKGGPDERDSLLGGR